jgi:hypothetical protein
VPEEVQQLQHQDQRLRQDHAVAHRREPHGRQPGDVRATVRGAAACRLAAFPFFFLFS